MNMHERILALLKDNNVQFKHIKHDFVHTSEQAAQIRNTNLEQAAKALILKAKKENTFFQFVLGGNKKLDLKKIKKKWGIKNLSLAHPDEVLEKTGCKIGTVPPFGNLFNIQVHLDKNLPDTQKEIVFSAATHYDSIMMSTQEYIKVVKPIIDEYSKE